MRAFCSICRDIFSRVDTEVVQTTLCGHMFHYVCLVEWLERSKTCPKCRSSVDKNKTITLHFDFTSDTVQDSSVLEDKVQSLSHKLFLKEHDIKKLTKENEEAKKHSVVFRSEILKAEDRIRNHETELCSLQNTIKKLKIQGKFYNEMKLRVDELQLKLEQYENIEKVLKGAADDAAEILKMMKDVTDPSILCACMNTLKKETQTYKEKAKDLQRHLNTKERTLSFLRSRIEQLESEKSILNRSLNKLQDDLNHTESENENLRKKCKELGEAIMSSDDGSSKINARDRVLSRLINESPAPALNNTLSGIDLEISSSLSVSSRKEPAPISPVRLFHLKENNKSFLNKRRLLLNETTASSSSSLQCYDGFGGHVKEDVPRTDRATLLRVVERKKQSKTILPKKIKLSVKNQTSNIEKFCVKKGD